MTATAHTGAAGEWVHYAASKGRNDVADFCNQLIAGDHSLLSRCDHLREGFLIFASGDALLRLPGGIV